LIYRINEVSKIKAFLAKNSAVEFNATLPLSLEVLEKKDNIRYLIKAGNKTFTTKSLKELEIAVKYWGEFNETKEGIINISKLLKKPKLLQKQNFDLSFEPKILFDLLLKKEPKKDYKALILDKLSNAKNKNEFVTLTNILIALNAGVFHIPVKWNSKNELFQFRQKKGVKLKQNCVEFYAAFENLGPIEGKLEQSTDSTKITLFTFYKKTYDFLKSEMENLEYECTVFMKESINPLQEFSQTLLDIKG